MRPISSFVRKYSFFVALALSLNAALPAGVYAELGRSALRVQQDLEALQLLAAGLEEKIVIRPMTEKIIEEHWKQIVRILNQIWTPQGIPRTTAVIAPDARDPRFSFIALSAGNPVGVLVARRRKMDSGTLYMSWLGVDQERRDNGIGTQLMERLFQAAREDSNIRRVRWHTLEADPEAQRFYERLGARKMEAEDGFRQYEMLLRDPPGDKEPVSFHPSEFSPRVLVRAEPKGKLPRYSLQIAEHLSAVMAPFFQESLQSEYGLDETPLVYLPGPSRALGKPVYLLREALLPTGSSKPRMLAVLFDWYLNKDPYRLIGRQGKGVPSLWGTQSTGNHLLSMSWGGRTLRDYFGWPAESLRVMGFTMRGIPAVKKKEAERFGAQVLDRYDNYAKAREAMEQEESRRGGDFIHWHHGDRPVILGNMATALQLKGQIEREDRLRGKKIAVISATGSGGRLAGLAAGLSQLFGDRVKIIGAETEQTRPMFEAVNAGVPVLVQLPPQRVAEDGIAVDEAEPAALDVILTAADAVALVNRDKDAVPFTLWLIQELKQLGRTREPTVTEVVTGMSLAVPFVHPRLVEDMDAVIIDETGRNIDPADLENVEASPLPIFAGLKEPGKVSAQVGLEEFLEEIGRQTGA